MQKPTILFVDDDKLICRVITESLGEKNYTLLTAQSGEEGLAKLRENDNVDLLIADQKMEKMTGLELLKIVKKEYPDIITIMLTAHADIETAIEAINEAGVFKFVIKPWNAFDLRLTVFRALETRQLLMEKQSLHKQIKINDILIDEITKKHPKLKRIASDIRLSAAKEAAC